MELKRYLRVVGRTGDDDDDYSIIEISHRRAREAADYIEKLEAELHHCFHRIEELQAALREITVTFWDRKEIERIVNEALEGK